MTPGENCSWGSRAAGRRRLRVGTTACAVAGWVGWLLLRVSGPVAWLLFDGVPLAHPVLLVVPAVGAVGVDLRLTDSEVPENLLQGVEFVPLPKKGTPASTTPAAASNGETNGYVARSRITSVSPVTLGSVPPLVMATSTQPFQTPIGPE